MNILICCSGVFGGTDLLLERYYEWLKKKNINVQKVTLSKENKLNREGKKDFDIVVLPSSQMDELLKIRKMGYHFTRILIWIMGMGAFRDSYFNEKRNHGAERIINAVLRKNADKMLRLLYETRSICFTDEVGMENTFVGTNIEYTQNKVDNLVPIAIKVPNKFLWDEKDLESKIRVAWIGRVSKDFKLIPILQLMRDIEKCQHENEVEFLLTIIGTGDGLEEVKQEAVRKSFAIQFVDSIDYENIGAFLRANVDIFVGMGTSVLDSAKNGCPSVVITPVRESDTKEVYYRWIFESKGFSLGEYPSIKVGPEQVKKDFNQIFKEYEIETGLDKASYEYTLNFDENVVFTRLLNRKLPEKISVKMWLQIFYFAFWKGIKNRVKTIVH